MTGGGPSWGWVLLGIPAGLLATADQSGVGPWRLVGWVAGAVWRIPHVATVITCVGVVAALALLGTVALRTYRGWGW